jgi:hypothetical protein
MTWGVELRVGETRCVLVNKHFDMMHRSPADRPIAGLHKIRTVIRILLNGIS